MAQFLRMERQAAKEPVAPSGFHMKWPQVQSCPSSGHPGTQKGDLSPFCDPWKALGEGIRRSLGGMVDCWCVWGEHGDRDVCRVLDTWAHWGHSCPEVSRVTGTLQTTNLDLGFGE